MPTILLVEDEYPMRVALEDAFRHYGYEVISAPDGESGLKLGEERKPDLVILMENSRSSAIRVMIYPPVFL